MPDLLDTIYELAMADQLGTRAKNLAQIHFAKAEILGAITAGNSLLKIWRSLKNTNQLSCSYPTFRRHIRRLSENIPPQA